MARVRILGSKDENILSISLRHILQCVTQEDILSWKVLWFRGIGSESEDILKLETIINQSSSGISYSYRELLKLSDTIFQLLEIVIIGSTDENKLIRYQEDNTMYNTCEYVIELIDSSYWEVSSNSIDFINKIKQNLEGVEDIL